MDTKSFREQQFFLNVIIISRVIPNSESKKKNSLPYPVLVFLINFHQAHHIFGYFFIIIYLIWKSHIQIASDITCCDFSRFYALKGAKLNLKRFNSVILSTRKRILRNWTSEKQSISLINAEWAESKLMNNIYRIVLFMQVYYLIYIFIIFFFI